MKQPLWILCLALAGMSCNSPGGKQVLEKVSIIPQPREISLHKKTFKLDAGTCILADDGLLPQARQLQAYLLETTGLNIALNEPLPGSNFIELNLDTEAFLQGDEAYQIRSSSRRIQISASTGTGVFYGIQTLRQLLPASQEPMETIKFT